MEVHLSPPPSHTDPSREQDYGSASEPPLYHTQTPLESRTMEVHLSPTPPPHTHTLPLKIKGNKSSGASLGDGLM